MIRWAPTVPRESLALLLEMCSFLGKHQPNEESKNVTNLPFYGIWILEGGIYFQDGVKDCIILEV